MHPLPTLAINKLDHYKKIDNEASLFPVDNFGTVVGENPTPYGILALWSVNGLSIFYWVPNLSS